MNIVGHEARHVENRAIEPITLYTFWAEDGTIIQQIGDDYLQIGNFETGVNRIGGVATDPNANEYLQAIDDYWYELEQYND